MNVGTGLRGDSVVVDALMRLSSQTMSPAASREALTPTRGKNRDRSGEDMYACILYRYCSEDIDHDGSK
jgi:hypothetical protein